MGLNRKGISNGRSHKYNQFFAKEHLKQYLSCNVLNGFVVYDCNLKI